MLLTAVLFGLLGNTVTVAAFYVVPSMDYLKTVDTVLAFVLLSSI